MSRYSTLPHGRDITRLFVLTLIYVIAGKFGLKLAFINASASAVWAPTGIAFAAFLLLGYSIWPAIFLGAFLVNITTAGSLTTSFGIALGNTLEGVLGAFLVNRFAHGRRVFDEPYDIFKFTLLAALASTTVSPTLGVTSLALGGFAPWASYGPIWLTWWLGDAGGNLIIAPLLVLWSLKPARPRIPARTWEAGLMALSLLFIDHIVFGGLIFQKSTNYPLEFICFPVVIWVAFRTGPRETALGIFGLSVMAIWGTLHGFGPFVRSSPNTSLLLLQTFMGVVAVMGLAIAAVVSERRQAQEDLQRAHDDLEQRVQERTTVLAETATDLKAANQELEAFSYSVSHDLRTPLRAIDGFSKELLIHCESYLQDSDREDLQRIRIATQRMAQLIEDLLDLARLSRSEMSWGEVDLSGMMHGLAAELKTRDSARRIEFVIQPNLMVQGDARLLHIALENLLTNAWKFSQRTQHPTIEFGMSGHDGQEAFYIRDNGVGFNMAYAGNLFKAFQRLHDPKEFPGSGIGLALVQRIIQRHGGRIWAQAEENRGATFYFTLAPSANPRSSKTVDAREGVRA